MNYHRKYNSMLGFIINRVRHTKEKLTTNDGKFYYYILLTSNNIDPFICVALGDTEGKLYLNIDKKSFETSFKCFEKLSSNKPVNLIGLRADQIFDMVDRGEITLENHDFNIIL